MDNKLPGSCNKLIGFLLAVMLVLVAGPPAFCQQFEYVGVGLFAGGIPKMEFSGDYLFGCCPLQSFNFISPDSFQFIGGYPFIDGMLGFDIQGGYAYITYGPDQLSLNHKFLILGISNPAVPLPVYEEDIRAAWDLAVSGNYL
jgi:hypothetical protein